MPRFLSQPYGDRLGDLLIHRLQDSQWTTFQSAVAFVKRSGVAHIAGSLGMFAQRGHVRMTVGVSMGGTSVEGLESLLECLDGRGEVWVFHNEDGPTFHPKIYVFSNESNAEVIIGSGNLTQGGLFNNYEASVALKLDLADAGDRAVLTDVEAILDGYTDPAAGTGILLSRETIKSLRTANYVIPESQMGRSSRRPTAAGVDLRTAPAGAQLFRHVAVPLPPTISAAGSDSETPRGGGESPAAFYMTLQQTDAGTGQTTPGTAERSPEIFIPLAARNAASEFWRWPEAFTDDPQEAGKRDRTGVPMLIGDSIEGVTMTYFAHRHDFRLRNRMLRSAGTVGDVLRIERADSAMKYAYSVTVIRDGAPGYAQALERCDNAVRNSKKRWGYE